jgi:hypothetical protein
MALFVFRDGKIGGADMSGVTFSGHYVVENSRVVGTIKYVMPAGSVSITGAHFEKASKSIDVPLDLPTELDERETYRINTPIGPVNAKFVRNVSFGANDGVN